MKLNKLLLGFAFWGIALTSCIQDEPLNAEADILTCTVPGTNLITSPIVLNDEIIITVTKETDLSKIAPEFTLTPGANIQPQSGTVRDFNNPTQSVTYKVTSEDQKWSKEYKVIVINSDLTTIYNFEDITKSEPYFVFAEKQNGVVNMQWASGNAGFSFTGQGKNPYDFPTLQSTDGKTGKCLQLVTRSTGTFGSDFRMPIAAGNLFMGKFDVLSALSNALKATQFGVPFYYVPSTLVGYYKYKAGDVYKNVDGNVVEGKRDICDIYALFYEAVDGKLLDGTNAFTSPNLVSLARIKNAKETGDKWTRFELPFILKEGKTIDHDKLIAGKYNIALVFSSSIDGGEFSGAVGSTLYVDEVQLIYDEK